MNRKIVKIKLEDIKPYENNPRINDNAVDKVVESIKEFGFTNPILLDKDNVIIAGHTRYEACKKLNLSEAYCLYLDDLNDEQVKAYRLVDNKTAEFAEWDFELLNEEILDIENIDLELFGFEKGESIWDKIENNPIDSCLADSFVINPFSYWDTTKKEWQDRKKWWKDIGVKSEIGRSDDLTYGNLKTKTLSGTSIFDPVVCELSYSWFIPNKGGKVLDPFAGGSVRGVVATKLGYEYTGIDLRKEQVKANYDNAKEIGLEGINWICDDSLNMDKYVADNSVDLVFTCPPYFDLEVYSDNEKDISNMDYGSFSKIYTEILKKSAKKLKENRFAIVVISDVRDKKGFYRDLVGLTKKAFSEEGVYFYNDIILLNSVGSAAIRARRSMNNRKLVRLHQNVLCFFKGDPKKIKNDFKEIEIDIIEEE